MTKLRVAIAGVGIGRQHAAVFRELPERPDYPAGAAESVAAIDAGRYPFLTGATAISEGLA